MARPLSWISPTHLRSRPQPRQPRDRAGRRSASLGPRWRVGPHLGELRAQLAQPLVDRTPRSWLCVLDHRLAPDLVLMLLASPQRVLVEDIDELQELSLRANHPLSRRGLVLVKTNAGVYATHARAPGDFIQQSPIVIAHGQMSLRRIVPTVNSQTALGRK